MPNVNRKEKNTYNRFSPCGCNSHVMNAPCHCGFCAEEDRNGNLILRTDCGASALNSTWPHPRSGDYESLQNSHNTPCTLKVTLAGMDNLPMDESPFNDCVSLNGEYSAYHLPNTTNSLTPCNWTMYMCGEDVGYDARANLTTGGLFLGYYPDDGFVAGTTGYRDVNLFAWAKQVAPCGNEQYLYFKKKKVGEAFVKASTRSTTTLFGFPTTANFPIVTNDCNSTVRCTRFSGLVLDEDVLINPTLATTTIGASYPKVSSLTYCDTNSLQVIVDSVDDFTARRGNALYAYLYQENYVNNPSSNCAVITGTYYPHIKRLDNDNTDWNTITTILPGEPHQAEFPRIFLTEQKAVSIGDGRTGRLAVAPESIKVTITGAASEPYSSGNPRVAATGCNDCESLNGEHILRLTSLENPFYPPTIYPQYAAYYTKQFTFYDKLDPSGQKLQPICCRRDDDGCANENALTSLCLSHMSVTLPSGSPSIFTLTRTGTRSHLYAATREYDAQLNGTDFLLDGYTPTTGIVVLNNARSATAAYCNYFSGINIQIEPYFEDGKLEKVGCVARNSTCATCYGGDAPEEMMVTIPDAWVQSTFDTSVPEGFNSLGNHPDCAANSTSTSMVLPTCGTNGFSQDPRTMPVGPYVLRRLSDTLINNRSMPFCDGTHSWSPGCTYYYENPERTAFCGQIMGVNVNPFYSYDCDGSTLRWYSRSTFDSGAPVSICGWTDMILSINNYNLSNSCSDGTSPTLPVFDFKIRTLAGSQYSSFGSTCTLYEGCHTIPDCDHAFTSCVSGTWGCCCGIDATIETYNYSRVYNFRHIMSGEQLFSKREPQNPTTRTGSWIDCENIDVELKLVIQQGHAGAWNWGNALWRRGQTPFCYTSAGAYVPPDVNQCMYYNQVYSGFTDFPTINLVAL